MVVKHGMKFKTQSGTSYQFASYFTCIIHIVTISRYASTSLWRDRYLHVLPTLLDLISRLAEATVFSSLGAASGFYQIPLHNRQAFNTFTEKLGITHVTSSPHYVRSNGLAERYVRYIKGTLKKPSDMQLALLNIRATPVDAKPPSPADMLLGRPLATLLTSRSEPGM